MLADPNGPVTKAPDHSGPPGTEQPQLDLKPLVSALGVLEANSTDRDGRFGLARLVLA